MIIRSPLLKGYEPLHNTEYTSHYIGKNPYDRSPNKNLSDTTVILLNNNNINCSNLKKYISKNNQRISPIPSFADQFKSTFMNDYNNKRKFKECPVKT